MSGNHGSYLLIGDMVGVNVPISTSVKVNKKMEGSLRSKKEIWKNLSEDEKLAFLTEQHEFAHHQLMTSSIAGVFYWRLNETWSRDVSWLSHKLSELGLHPDNGMNLREWWKRDGNLRAKIVLADDEVLFSYLEHVFEHLHKVNVLLDYLYGDKLPQENMPRGEFSNLLSTVFEWCAERCGLSLCGSHDYYHERSKNRAYISSQSPVDTIFPAKEAYNLQSLFEVYSICRELFVLQLVGDESRAQDLLAKTLKGRYASAINLVIPMSQSNDWALSFSPHIAMQHILMMCNSPLDISTYKKADHLEDILPWLVVESKFSKHRVDFNYLVNIGVRVCRFLQQPLFTENSNWLKYVNIKNMDELEIYFSKLNESNFSDFHSAIASNAVNQAAFTFKINLSSTLKLLLDMVKKPEGLDSYQIQRWYDDTKKSMCIIEYSDDVWISTEPAIKANDKLKEIVTTIPELVICGLVVRAHSHYMQKGYWEGACRPDLSILIEKLKGKSELAYNYLSATNICLETQAKTLYPNTIAVNCFDLYCDQ
ncbi:hypothetical protein AB6D85_25350 [Vibrio splendidus]